MIISDIHKAIFIHNAKTGGESIDEAFEDSGCVLFGPHNLRPLNPRMFALEVKNKINKEIWDGYFKFAFVRNPWDRLVSAFYHFKETNKERVFSKLSKVCNKEGKYIIFKEFVLTCLVNKAIKNSHWEPQYLMVCDKDKNIILDYIARFERFDEEIRFIFNKIKLDKKINHLNFSKHEHYTYYYDEETINIVEEYYKTDIEMFGYKFV